MYKRSITIKSCCIFLCAWLLLSLCGYQNGLGNVGTSDSAGTANVVGNNLNNIQNDGYMAVQNEYMYFYQNSPHQGLYRSKVDGSEKVKLLDGITRSINVVGDKLYFVKDEFVKKTTEEIKDLYKFNLYSSNLDGSGETKLIENCGSAYVTSDYIYYMYEVDLIAYTYDGEPVPNNQGYLYRFDLRTSEFELLVAETVHDFWVENDVLYYTGTNQDSVLRVSLSSLSSAPFAIYSDGTSEKQVIRQFAVRPDHRLLINDWKSLFLYDEAASKSEILDSEYLEDAFADTENDIYYIKNLENVYKLSMNTKKSVKVCPIDYKADSIPRLYCFGNDCYLFDGIETPRNIALINVGD